MVYLQTAQVTWVKSNFLLFFQTTRTLFHICGLKCMNCSSYNTARAAEPEEPAEDAACATPGGASAATADASVEETDRSDDI